MLAEVPEPEEEEVEPDEPESKEENNSKQELIKELQEKLTIYEMAEQKAKRNNESAKARRYNRGVRTLKEMIASAQSGRDVNEADIPPALPLSATTESTTKDTQGTQSNTYLFSYVLFIKYQFLSAILILQYFMSTFLC